MNQTKKVNIYPKNAITTITPPIRTAVKNITKPISDIRKCLIARAYVEEVLPDGELIVLDFTNYNLDNTKPVVKEPIAHVEEATVVEEAKVEPQEANVSDEVQKPAVEPIIEESTPVEIPVEEAAPVVEKVKEESPVVTEEPKVEVQQQAEPLAAPVVNNQPQQQNNNNNQKRNNNKKNNRNNNNNNQNNNIVK